MKFLTWLPGFKRIPHVIDPIIPTPKPPKLTKAKDPTDYTKDSLSTGWKTDDRYCTKCLKSTNHDEFMSDICNNCGSFNTQVRYCRVYRKIYIDGAWKYQVRYKDGHEEIREDWY